MIGCDWCVSIVIVPLWSCFPKGPIWSCSLGGSLMYRSPVVFLDRWYPRFRNFNSVVPIDVIRVKSYVDSFLDPTGVPVWASINKRYLVPKRVVTGLVGVLRNGGGMGTGESYIPVMFFDPLLHRSSCFANVDVSAFTGNPVDYAVLFSRIDGALWSH